MKALRVLLGLMLSVFVTWAHGAEAQQGATQDSVVVPATPVSAVPLPETANLPRGVIKLDETVISGNQELPKVLYILPWHEPGGLPEIELQTEFAEKDVFRRLYPPAYRRELAYFKTLDETE